MAEKPTLTPTKAALLVLDMVAYQVAKLDWIHEPDDSQYPGLWFDGELYGCRGGCPAGWLRVVRAIGEARCREALAQRHFAIAIRAAKPWIAPDLPEEDKPTKE
jgi:hypothetical protein